MQSALDIWRHITDYAVEMYKTTKKKIEDLSTIILDFDCDFVEHYRNVCGDKALHMCLILAYTYKKSSPQRGTLVRIAKELIEKRGVFGMKSDEVFEMKSDKNDSSKYV